ncbi:LysR family transcriptional regulator [Aeromicrobium piscarium]|uniref:LysR family transcriptional regulator n=1 Tax=Aeromicrobium piscarium TaxID=2590901 RepID=A0A554SPE2_9ACTN|nr:LysR family transcriptional regulator [Aeromicrobium piscarium]TSD68188.1 LysR family transcriptional regulator [Aeromicrobium piscarium]
MTPDLEAVEVLLAVDELGSIGRAAERLAITQPAASARLRSMEARWGLTLVERSARGSHLTSDGRAVAGWAASVMDQVTAMNAGLQALRRDHDRDVRIAASLTIAGFLMPAWLGALRGQRPDASPQLAVVNSAEVIERLRSGTADVGFIETTDLPEDLATRRVGTDTLAVVVAPGHQWATRDSPVTDAELAAEPLVLREPGSGTRRTFDAALARMPVVALEAGSTASLIGAAQAGIGPAVVSARAVRGHLDRGELVEVETDLDLRRPLTVLWSWDRRLSVTAEVLLLIATGKT